MKLSQKYKYIYNNEEELFCRIYLHSLLIHLYTFLYVLRVRIFEIKSICVFLLFLLLFSCIGTSFAFCTLINIYVCTCVCVCILLYRLIHLSIQIFLHYPSAYFFECCIFPNLVANLHLKNFHLKTGGIFHLRKI